MEHGTSDKGQQAMDNGQRTKENRQGIKGTRDLLYSSKIVEVKNIEWTYLKRSQDVIWNPSSSMISITIEGI